MTDDTIVTAKQQRLLFATACVAEIFPDVDEDRKPKKILFQQASMAGMERGDRPPYFSNVKQLRNYIRNKWPVIRLMLPEELGITPCYINGPTFGGGGGYRKGNAKLVRKQLAHDKKIASGVVTATDNFAQVAGALYPAIEVERVRLVTRPLVR